MLGQYGLILVDADADLFSVAEWAVQQTAGRGQ